VAENSPYRKAALAKLSSPEELDRLVTVTSSRSWIALLTLCGTLVVVVVWAFFGAVPVTISGPGILVGTGGIAEVSALGAGMVREISVREGDRVEAGAVVAVVDQTLMENEIRQMRSRIEELQDRWDRTSAMETDRERLGLIAIDKEAEDLRREIGVSEERLTWLASRATSQSNAVKMGLITEAELRETIKEIEAEKSAMASDRTRLTTLNSERHALRARREEGVSELESQISEEERRLELRLMELDQMSRVVSPHAGRVAEIKAAPGSPILAGQAILSIEPDFGRLQAMVFPVTEAKKIRPGMTARIALSTVKKENHGYILGRVESVSSLPSTREGMMRILRNDLLVDDLSARGAPFMLVISLELDPNTASGLKWTTVDGAPGKVESGTLCQADVVVEIRRPITLLLPALKSFFGT
jgi:HlyD family secretion protein